MQKKLKLATILAAFAVLFIFTGKYFFTKIGSLAFYQSYVSDSTEKINNSIKEKQQNAEDAADKNKPVNYSEMEIFNYNIEPKDIDPKSVKRQYTKKLDYTNYEDRVRMSTPARLDSNGLYVALLQAVTDNDIDRAKYLIDRKARLDSPDGDTSLAPIFWAISNGNVEMVKLLIQKGVRVNTPDENGNFPIHWVVETSSNRPYVYHTKEIFDLILDAHPGEINRQDTRLKQTPLMMAVALNNTKAFAYLMDKGANTQIINKDKKDIMDIILENACQACVQFMESKQKQNEITPLPNFASTFTAPDPIWLPYAPVKKTTTKKKKAKDPNAIVIQGDSMSLPTYKEMPQILPLKEEKGPDMIIPDSY